MEYTGNLSGQSQLSYFANVSRKQAFNPILICDEQPYTHQDCPIAAIEYDGFSPNKIINVISHENDIYENSLEFNKTETLSYNGYTYPIIHYPYYSYDNSKLKYIVTDQSSLKNDPLFFQYELLYDAYSDTSGIAIKNIYKNNENIIDKSEYIVQYSTDILENNTRYSSTVWGSPRNTNQHRIRILLPFYFSSKKDFYSVEYTKVIYGIKTYQKELIECKTVYTTSDYSITSSGLIPTGMLSFNKNIYIMKDPLYRIAPLDILTVKDQNGYINDKSSQWKLRLNLGSFYQISGYYTGTSGRFYNLENYYTSQDIPLTNIRPTIVDSNILQVKEVPIYVNTINYTYPNYKIDPYVNNMSGLIDISGKFGVAINGTFRNDYKIKSIDREKGFIEFNQDFNKTDEIELFYYLRNSGFLILDNIELNPKISISGGARYHINNYKNGLGLALQTMESGNIYPYIYDTSVETSSRIVSGIYDIGDPSSSSSSWNNTFFTICEINLNKLTPGIVKVTDARKVVSGPIINKTFNNWINNFSGSYKNEYQFYTDIGKYDGNPLPHNSTIIIHIPEDKINTNKQKWIDYYKKYYDYDMAIKISEKEFKHYLDQFIKRYISAGTDYIIYPTISGIPTGKVLEL